MKIKQIVWGILVLSSCVLARENPFVPVVDQENMPQTSLEPTVVPQLKNFEIQMPSGAKIIESIDIHYQDAAAKTKTQTFEIDKKINWQNPLYLSHRPIQHYPKKEYTPIEGLRIIHEGMQLYIHTRDTMLRNFHLIDPFKLVFDFETDESFYSQKEAMTQPAKELSVGSHRGYYRVVFELDAVYRYEVSKTERGVKIELK